MDDPIYTSLNFVDSKSDHLSIRIIEIFFFILSKLFTVFDNFSKWRVMCQMSCRTQKNHQIRMVLSQLWVALSFFDFSRIMKIFLKSFFVKNEYKNEETIFSFSVQPIVTTTYFISAKAQRKFK